MKTTDSNNTIRREKTKVVKSQSKSSNKLFSKHIRLGFYSLLIAGSTFVVSSCTQTLATDNAETEKSHSGYNNKHK